jgi:hypothetical protein
VQDGRCYVIRQISVNRKTLSARQFLKIHSHYIAFDNLHVLAWRNDFAQPPGKARVEFNGKHLARVLREARRHFSVPRSDFHPHSMVDMNGARNPFLPTCVGEEMLS